MKDPNKMLFDYFHGLLHCLLSTITKTL